MDSSIISSVFERIFQSVRPTISRGLHPRDADLRAEIEIAYLLDWLGKVNFGLEDMTVRLSADGIDIGGGDWRLGPTIAPHHSICFDDYCPAPLFAAIIETHRASLEGLLAWHLMGGRGACDQKGLAAIRKIARVTDH